MNRAIQILILVVLTALLAGVLFTLIDIARNGVRLELAGSVDVRGMPQEIALSMGEPVTLVLDDSANLTVTGPDGGSLPASLSLLPCPECGAPMLPVRWNPWSGEIEWACTSCDAVIRLPAAP